MNREKFRKMYDLLMEQLDVSRELSDDEILGVIDELILTQARELFLSLKEKVELRQELFCSVRKLDVLQELIDDESVTEIMVNGPDHIFVERGGKLTRWNKVFTSEEKLEDVIQQIVGRCNRVVNESMPFLLRRVGLENRERKCEVTNENMWKYVKEFAMEEDAVGVVEIILILVVLISLVIIFKEQLTALVKKILTKITKQSNTI